MEEPIILLVEDDLALLDGMCDTLEMMGYKTIRATNGREGIDVLKQVRPDLIISDIMMPEMDGYAFHQAVSSEPETATIPFIFLTAKSDQADVRRGLRDGVDAYLTKPFDLEDLLIHVQNKLDRFATIRKQALAQLENLQHQIVTMFSHELRTPLTYIQGYTDLLTDVPGGNISPDEITLFLEGIRAGSRRLNRLVENLLALVQLDTHVYTHEFVRFASPDTHIDRLILYSVKSLEPVAASKGIPLEVTIADDLPPVRIISSHFTQALNNLIDNAIKFTTIPGTAVRIVASCQDNQVCVDVIDQGIGVSTRDLPHVFERFRQIDRAKHEQPGIGVGLAIAQGLVRVQGGDILVESKVNAGSTFTICLPVYVEHQG